MKTFEVRIGSEIVEVQAVETEPIDNLTNSATNKSGGPTKHLSPTSGKTKAIDFTEKIAEISKNLCEKIPEKLIESNNCADEVQLEVSAAISSNGNIVFLALGTEATVKLVLKWKNLK